MADDTITDIMVNGPGRVWVERGGVVERTSVMLDRPTIDHLIERMVGPIGRRVDRTSPLVDARLGDGSRVHVVVPPIAVDGPYVTVRRFRTLSVGVEHMAAPAVVELLSQAVAHESNIVVTGGTGSGKTTLLNALSRLQGCDRSPWVQQPIHRRSEVAGLLLQDRRWGYEPALQLWQPVM